MRFCGRFFRAPSPPVENHFASAVSARAQEIFEFLNADLAFSNRKLATPMTPQHTRLQQKSTRLRGVALACCVFAVASGRQRSHRNHHRHVSPPHRRDRVVAVNLSRYIDHYTLYAIKVRFFARAPRLPPIKSFRERRFGASRRNFGYSGDSTRAHCDRGACAAKKIFGGHLRTH